MKALKVILFVEIIAMIVMCAIHSVFLLNGEDFPLEAYPQMAGVVLLCGLFSVYVVTPLAELFFD
jgi:uncharacterized membrane protein